MVQGLESRWTPANVTASVVNGLLTLTATAGAFDDEIKINSGSNPGELDLVGTGTTINGQASVTLKGVRSIVCDMKGGNDLVTLSSRIAGGIAFNGGGGNNELEVQGSVGGAVRYLNGTATANDDRLTIGGLNTVIGRGVFADFGEGISYTTLGVSTIGGRVAVTGGSGADTIVTNGVTMTRGLSANLGDGANFVGIESDTDYISGGDTTFLGGGLFVTAGSGEDVIEIGQENSVTILGKVSLLTGSEASGGDTIKLDNSDFYSAFFIDLGAGNDTAMIESVDTLNASNDFHDALSILGRGGNDSVTFGQVGGARIVNLATPPVLDGGGGNDVLAVVNLWIGDVDVDTLPELVLPPLNFETILI
jgi:hypothetical protein